MKWFKLTFWLLAWSFWLWLGFGLHRELPRKVQTKQLQVANVKFCRGLGIVGADRVAVWELDQKQSPAVGVYDSETGRLVHRFPLSPSMRWPPATLFRQRYFLDGLSVIDLVEGTKRPNPFHAPRRSAPEWNDPCVALVEGTIRADRSQRVVLYDFEAQKEVFEGSVTVAGGVLDAPFYFPGDQKLALAGRPIGPYRDGDGTTFLVWSTKPSAEAEPLPETFNVGPSASESITYSSDGRAAYGPPDSDAFEVFDFRKGSVIFSRPATNTLPNAGPFSPLRPVISWDGMTVLGGWPRTLWNLDDGMPLWQARSHEAFPDMFDRRGIRRFSVCERWHQMWGGWLPPIKFETLAIRDASDGSLIHRIGGFSTAEALRATYGENFLMTNGGLFAKLPPSPNWPLLALCQTILALPLIFLWAILRWRSRRAARRQPAVGSHPGTQQ
jgi:hypothetical protein